MAISEPIRRLSVARPTATSPTSAERSIAVTRRGKAQGHEAETTDHSPERSKRAFCMLVERRSLLTSLFSKFALSCSTLPGLAHPGEHQRQVIRLLVLADPVLHGGNHNVGDSIEGEMTVAAHQIQQALLPELTILVLRLGNPVAESYKDIARR